MYFWNYYFNKLAKHESPKLQSVENNVTVLVCAKNERENLMELLNHLKKQNQKSSILIVDDFSTDDSISFLDASANKISALEYIQSSRDIPGKKQALIDGFKNIQGGLILLTDADCIPASNDWIIHMSSAVKNNELVLGYSPYIKRKGFLNLWIRYEAILTAIQYLSFALNGRPYMGVGRNVLYKKSLVHNGEALLKKMTLASGDDDLLINALANKNNTSIQINPEAWTFSKPKTTWGSYFTQKKRHMSTASSYKFSDQILLVLFSTSWILFYIMLFSLFFMGFWVWGLILLVLRFLSTSHVIAKLFSKLNGKDCIARWWYLDPFTALYFSIFSIFAVIPQRNKW